MARLLVVALNLFSGSFLPVTLADQLAENVRRLRLDADLTQKDLAKRLGLSHATLHRIERGAYNPSLRVLEELCEALDCRPGDLFEPGRLRLPATRICAFRSSRSPRSEHRDHADRRIMIGAKRRGPAGG